MRLAIVVFALAAAACGRGSLENHRAVTTEMLQQRGVPDFVDASTAHFSALRHTPSGMLCILPADGIFEFDVFPGDAANAGAHCTGTAGEVADAWVAVQFSTPTTLDAVFATSIEDTIGADPHVWSGQPSEADRSEPQGLPHYRIGRFETDVNGDRHYVRVALTEADGWYLQQIVSAPIAAAETAERDAGLEWRSTLRAFAAARAEARTADAPATEAAPAP